MGKYNNQIQTGLLMKVWVSLPAKETSSTEVLLKARGIKNGLWKKVVLTTTYDHVVHYGLDMV